MKIDLKELSCTCMAIDTSRGECVPLINCDFKNKPLCISEAAHEKNDPFLIR